ncbi:MAG TPA: 16S rRNA (adenine(1518)-N(6)/adenine(1519)-N(6))-dimethyltransferase RsmA [Syntrophorhabdaceae bacterium]|nr:16S rRNA (adenine(1518)-N(6)/adenine(1519)-N(6))-dimethyltransferase RsmA [Syntrophorhabdaceae bacterium]HPU28940.1 16S rRNA (adenine(1518)-N(6)/adenine(1519)-N(6))-dimethyltransferase RsmA [Syntrophorhabdaceae bacterium]
MLKKSLSQHLIKDKNLLKKMVRLSEISNDDTILEIGAGQGDLTRHLCEKGGNVFAVEIDRAFQKNLDSLKEEFKNLNFIICDFLEFDMMRFYKGISDKRIKVFGNIPYKITGPILFKLINHREILDSAFLTVQKEIGERITAKPSNKTYGALSVICQLVSDVKILLNLKPHIFIPPPRVDSVFLSMIFKHDCGNITDKHISFIRMCFENKRKIMKNTLIKHFEIERVLELYKKLDLPLNIRAEQLEPQMFLNIYRFFHEKG